MQAKLGPDHRETLDCMNGLAWCYADLGKFDKAIAILKQRLERQESQLGPDDPGTIRALRDLARGYRAAGKQDLALPLVEKAFALAEHGWAPTTARRSSA